MRKRQFSQPLHLCLVLGLFACLSFTIPGCGGNTSGGTTPPPHRTITSVTETCSASSVDPGQTITCSGVEHWSDGSTDATVSYKSDNTAAATVASSGTVTGVAAGTANIIATSTTDSAMTASVKLTVNAPQATITSVTVTPATATVTAGGTATFAANVSGTGSYSTGVTWSVSPASAGAITSDGGFTASTAITTSTAATVTATSTQDSTKSGTAQVTVNPAPAPTITSISPQSAAIEDTAIMTLTINGTGITGGMYLDLGCLDPVTASYTSTQVSVDVQFNNSGAYSPGFCPIKLCTDSTEKSCSKTEVFAFVGSGNQMAVSSSGEIFFLDQTSKGNVRKYASDGTVETPLSIGGLAHCIAFDDKTQIIVIDDGTLNVDGTDTFIDPQGFSTKPVTGCAARHGYAAFIQPSDNNAVSWYDLTGGPGSTPTVHTVHLPDHPGAVDIGVFGGSTYIYVVTITGTPKLYEIDVSNGTIAGSAPALTGLTPLATAQLGDNPPPAGWYQVHAFDNGPATGTIAVFSAPDKLLSFADQSTMKVTASTTLSGTPMRVAADTANARVLIANIVPGTAATTTSEVDVATPSVETSLTATFTDFPVGFAVDSTGQTMYVGQRSDLQSAPIQ